MKHDRIAGSYERFQEDILKPMAGVLKRTMPATLKRAAEVKLVLEIDKPWVVPGPPPRLSPNERFAADSLRDFADISDTYQRFLDLGVYLRRFPFVRAGIPRQRYLRFLVESYLHEIYIMRERLTKYSKRITRAYRHSERAAAAASTLKMLAEVISLLDDAATIRSRHVHELRFDEVRLSNLTALELIAKYSGDAQMKRAAQLAFPRVRLFWVRWMRDTTTAIKAVLDRYFYDLGRFMFPRRRLALPFSAT